MKTTLILITVGTMVGLVLLTKPCFAPPYPPAPAHDYLSAREAKAISDSRNNAALGSQLPKLLATVNEEVQSRAAKGEYSANVDTNGYNDVIVKVAINKLVEEGFTINLSIGGFTVSWE